MMEFAVNKDTNAKLDPEHRKTVIPVIIRLLQSKLVRKKGAKKTIQVRRNLVYEFFSSLSENEFRLLFDEVLAPFKRGRLCDQSFHTFIKAIKQIDVILRQMGQLIDGYLAELAEYVLQIVYLAKLFKGGLHDDDEDHE